MMKKIKTGGGAGGGRRTALPPRSFLDLDDTPDAYTGAGSKFVTVKAGENGLEFTPLPPLAITDTFVVGSQAAMLALTAQRGDVAIRTDINQTFILQGDDPSILANWVLLLVSPVHAIGGALHTADTLANLKTKISAPDILITSQAAEISTLTTKATPAGADLLIIEDSADTNKKKKVLISTLPHTETFPEFQFFADQFKTPLASEYPKNGTGAAPLLIDTNNNSLLNRAFNDSTDQGVAFDLKIPAGATNIIFDMIHRAEIGPATSKGVTLSIYTRQISDNAAVPAWSAEYEFSAPLTIPANEYWQYDTETIPLSSLSITAGNLVNFELVRDLAEAGSTLIGDWNLNFLKVRFS